MARPAAQFDDRFRSMLDGLAENGTTVFENFDGATTRQWQIPSELEKTPLDSDAIVDAFNRDSINANYSDLFKSANEPGTTGDVVAVKRQCDLLAADERAFRARHASLPRLLLLAAARRRAHGAVSGLFKKDMLSEIADTIAAAAVVEDLGAEVASDEYGDDETITNVS